MTIILKVAAPYVAVAVCWCFFHNGWAAILVYHAQILFLSRKQIPKLFHGWNTKLFLTTALPCSLGGVLVYFLIPHISATPLSDWLAKYQVTGWGLILMIPYFGLVHTLLEQAHWSDIRKRGWHIHALFAGYHALVLYDLLALPWLAACMLILFGASYFWHRASEAMGGLIVPVIGHIFADLGIVIAAWHLVS